MTVTGAKTDASLAALYDLAHPRPLKFAPPDKLLPAPHGGIKHLLRATSTDYC